MCVAREDRARIRAGKWGRKIIRLVLSYFVDNRALITPIQSGTPRRPRELRD